MRNIAGKRIIWLSKGLFMFFSAMLILFTNCAGPSKKGVVNLDEGFKKPPESAKPRVWWHWMNGNITKDGIKADLEWMKRTGIGGFQNFDAGLATPQIVEKRLIYMTPEWKDAFLFTTRLADSLGLEMAIAGSPGWSESGGPWVKPEQAMKKLVWSEIRVNGGEPFTGIIPRPPSVPGMFQNIPAQSSTQNSLPEYYRDVAVIACKIPSSDISIYEMNPKVTSPEGRKELSQLADGDLTNYISLSAAAINRKTWLQFEFTKPVTICSFTLVSNETGGGGTGQAGRRGYVRTLESSNDGKKFDTFFEIPGTSNIQRTFTFAPVTAKFFRLSFLTPQPPQTRPGIGSIGAILRGTPQEQRGEIKIAEAVLHTVPRINRVEDKAGYTSAAGLYALATSEVSPENVVKKSNIIDLTSKMQSDGTIDWTPPEGRWKIIRFGYSLTGRQNHPASPEATGLEVDKLNAEHVRAYFENYLDKYKEATGGLMGERGLQYVVTDSWEAGVQNWTDSMIVEFTRLRGYDPTLWLPVVTGQIVESAEASEKFLWDFRKTIGDLTAKNHYDQLTSILKERQMGRYTESHESGRAFIGDGMEVKRKADIPMSAMWTPRGFGGTDNGEIATGYKADVLESASVAHIYGQNIVAAESMTASGNSFAYSPERLKPTADMELAMGVNRFVIHTSVHQPVSDKKPGLGLGPYGQWFTRHETWAEQAGPWITYLARSSFMLQQGKFVADILYYYGEDNNITALFGNKLPDIPKGYRYDFINTDALINCLSVDKGMIVTPSGMSYKLLVLDENSRYMTLPALKKIMSLIEKGAVVSGPKPVMSPSLTDDDSGFQSLVNKLWVNEKSENVYGKGKLFTGQKVADIMKTLQIAPDFEYKKPYDNTNILFVHRKMAKADIYWVNNRNNRQETPEVIFRIEGKIPEIWDPVKGTKEPVSYVSENGRTIVPLKLEPYDALFIVFRKNTEETSLKLPKPVEKSLITIKGPWEVSFQPGMGAPEKIIMDSLASWTENSDAGVKYFSGTGTYRISLNADSTWFDGNPKLWLDMGSVKNLAEVTVNGKYLGIVWKRPFRVDITDALKPGENALEIKVTNLWVNRLIGDQQPGAKKYTYTAMNFYQADSPLLPSGLLGPVQILRITLK